jgi:hypothetical protein
MPVPTPALRLRVTPLRMAVRMGMPMGLLRARWMRCGRAWRWRCSRQLAQSRLRRGCEGHVDSHPGGLSVCGRTPFDQPRTVARVRGRARCARALRCVRPRPFGLCRRGGERVARPSTWAECLTAVPVGSGSGSSSTAKRGGGVVTMMVLDYTLGCGCRQTCEVAARGHRGKSTVGRGSGVVLVLPGHAGGLRPPVAHPMTSTRDVRDPRTARPNMIRVQARWRRCPLICWVGPLIKECGCGS